MIAACVSTAAVVASAQTGHYDAHEWGAAADTLRGATPGARIALRSAFLVPGSVRVVVNGEAFSPQRYQINYHLGTIRFRADLPAGAVVVVHYQRQPFLLDPVYSLRPADVSRPDSVEAPPDRTPVARASEAAPGPNLVFGGTKSVSFSTGTNRGSTLDQSLEATVEGQLTPTIKVRALLSDNNLPIQPQGNTEELQYFDRVFVEVEGPNARASVGDITLDDHTSSFSPLTRQLRGFAGAAWTRRGRVVGAAAETKGEFRNIQFRGTTGLQGPYPLLSQARTSTDVIIAGTEHVLVDGVRAERGQNRDYVIDYDQGTVTFTPRRLITTDTEISVDFEVTQQKYNRSTVLGGAEEIAVGRGVVVGVAVAREADDKSRPKNVVLSPQEIEVLEAAGDDSNAAITGGVQPADSGKGDYVQIPADSVTGTPAHFKFDALAGAYIVSFVEVPPGQGDYRRAGISARGQPYYEYVGAGNGVYRVGKRLPLPESLTVATARVGRATGALTFDAEWDVSDHDRNLYSSQDDADNTGHAGQATIGLTTSGRWRLGLTGAASLLEDRFASFDQTRPSYFYRDWNLEDVALVGREITGEVGASVSRDHVGSLRYSLGRLDRPDYDGVKHEARLESGSLADRGITARALDSDMQGDGNERTRRNMFVDAAWGMWKVVPGVSVGTETYRNAFTAAPDSGRAYDLVAGHLTNRHPDRLTWRLDAERRDTRGIDATTDAFIDTRRDDTVSGSLAIHATGATRVEVQLIHRREDDRVNHAETSTDLARLKAASAWDGIGLRADADYEVSQNDAATLQRSVIFVGDGKGDYNELGEPVGKGKGSYTVVFLPTTDSTPVHTVGFNLHIVWKPSGRPHDGTGFGSWVVRNVSVDQTIGVREESTYEPAWKVYLMVPSALQRSDATVFGTTTIRQDWSLLDGYKNVSLTFRYLRQDQEDNRFEGISEQTFTGEHALRLSRSLSGRLTATAEAGRQVERRGGSGIPTGTGSTYDVATLSALAGLGVVVAPGATVDVDVTAENAKDSQSGAEQRTIKFSPRIVWRVAEKINVFGSYELANVTNRGEAAVQPLVFAREGASQRWSITPNLKVSRVISVFATYSGRSERVFSGRLVTEHEFRLETRAYF
jgi:hypothetical protein